MRIRTALPWLFFAGILVSATVHAVPTYSFTDLGVLGRVTGLNDTGQVIGWKYDTSYKAHGVLYSSTGMYDLGASVTPTAINNSGQMAGVVSVSSGPIRSYFSDGVGSDWIDLGVLAGDRLSSTSAINEQGQILGASYLSFAHSTHAFISNGTTLTNIGSLGGGGAYGTSINNSGVVVGSASTSNGYSHAFFYDATGMHDLGTLGGASSFASAVNDSGQLAGYSYTANGSEHAATNNGYGLIDLGTLGGSTSVAFAINNNGQIVGTADTSGNRQTHAFIYNDSAMIDIGTLGGKASSAIGINDSGDVIGWSDTLNGSRAAFFYKNGDMIDLKTMLPGFTNIDTSSLFLNEPGQIAGMGQLNGQTHGFLITPTLAVPELDTYGMLIAGLSLLGFRCLRRQSPTVA